MEIPSESDDTSRGSLPQYRFKLFRTQIPDFRQLVGRKLGCNAERCPNLLRTHQDFDSTPVRLLPDDDHINETGTTT
jgi:hypothetical protein